MKFNKIIEIDGLVPEKSNNVVQNPSVRFLFVANVDANVNNQTKRVSRLQSTKIEMNMNDTKWHCVQYLPF